jgi:pimeloyl-ACP methyl ester carboxylesterase
MPFAKINNHNLHYTDIAPANGQPAKLTLIFVHGLGSTQNYFFPIFPYLTAYRCVIFDNYNAGRSECDGGEVSVEGMGRDVLGLMGWLGVERGVVVG